MFQVLHLEYVWVHLHQEYEELKANPEIKFPEKHMLKFLKRKECYQGCFSKWQRQRQDNSWDAFVDVAPELSKQHSEIPNAFRSTLNISCCKWNGSKYGKLAPTHIIPDPLALAIESMLVDAMTTGQEIGLGYITKTMNFMINLWNEHIHDIGSRMQGVLQDRIDSGEHVESCIALGSYSESDQTMSTTDPMKKLEQMLRTCELSTTHDGRRILGCDLIIYIYIYASVVQHIFQRRCCT